MQLRVQPTSPTDAERLLRRIACEPFPALLDSAGGPPHLRRWTIAACDPFHLLTFADGVTRRVDIRDGRAVTRQSRRTRHPLNTLRQALADFAVAPALLADATPEADLPAAGAAIGFLGYELGRTIERLPGRALRDTTLPDMHWAFYDHLLAIDHETNAAWIVACDVAGRDPQTLIDRWLRRIDEAAAAPAVAADAPPADTSFADLARTFTRDQYLAAVRRAIDYIAAGDIFQVNISQRFTAPLREPPLELYLRLRHVNAAPYAAYLATGNWAVLSSSPELFLDLRGDRVTTRPIKGTRPRRAADDDFNRRMIAELRTSPKEAAELVMIIDLLRNDLGRVCDYRSVQVTQPRVIEQYASVFHSVGQIEGRLNRRYDRVDLLRATFPGGSITGAPKVRAMQIIDELEPVARSVYTGAIGWLGFEGSMQLNVAIRTLIADGPRLHLQVGGGIVADSDPAAEYDETLAKARSMVQALGIHS